MLCVHFKIFWNEKNLIGKKKIEIEDNMFWPSQALGKVCKCWAGLTQSNLCHTTKIKAVCVQILGGENTALVYVTISV